MLSLSVFAGLVASLAAVTQERADPEASRWSSPWVDEAITDRGMVLCHPSRQWSPWSGESYTLPSSREPAEFRREESGARPSPPTVVIVQWGLSPLQERWLSPSPHDDYFTLPPR